MDGRWPLVLSMLREDGTPPPRSSLPVHQQKLSSSCRKGGTSNGAGRWWGNREEEEKGRWLTKSSMFSPAFGKAVLMFFSMSDFVAVGRKACWPSERWEWSHLGSSRAGERSHVEAVGEILMTPGWSVCNQNVLVLV